MQQNVRPHPPAGLTLIELLVALAVLVIVIGLTAPSLQQLLLKQRLSSLNNRLLISLNQARSEAIKQGRHVIFCASAPEQGCAVNQSEWQNGWLLFVDIDNNRQYSAQEPLLTEEPALKPALTLRWNRSQGVRFDPRGQTVGSNGSFSLCAGTDSGFSRKVVLSNTGRSRSETTDFASQC